MNVNEIADKLTAKGQEVSDLNAQLTAAAMDDTFDAEKFKNMKAERDTKLEQRNALQDTLKTARENAKVIETEDKKEPKVDDKKDSTISFVDKFKGMINNNPKIMNDLNSSTDETGAKVGLTIPVDQQLAIHQLQRQYTKLEDLVRTETVSTLSGKRIYETFQDITPLASLDSDSGLIPNNDDPKVHMISYEIKRYAGISTVTNSLLSDSAANIMAYLNRWIALKQIVTRNNEILKAVGTQPKKPTIKSFDDVKQTILTAVDPAIVATSSIITNVSGFAELAKVKTATGKYLVTPDVTQKDSYVIDNKPIVVVADRWLPDNAGTHPFIYGDLSQGITLYDRNQMSLLTTNIGGGAFENDTTRVRVIDRFDVELTDDGAFVSGGFTNIPDQKGTLTAEAGK